MRQPPPPQLPPHPRYSSCSRNFRRCCGPAAHTQISPRSPRFTSTQVAPGSTVPVFARPWRLDPDKHCIAEEEFLHWKKQVSFTDPIHLGRLPCTWCPKKTAPGAPAVTTTASTRLLFPTYRYSLPNMQSLNDSMTGCTFFLK
jgi:hypothetical protein